MFTIDYNIIYKFDISKNEYDINIIGFDYDSIHIIEDITEETNGVIIETIYQSKSSKYLRYNRCPYNVDNCSYFIVHTVRLKNKDTVLYFEYLLDKILNSIHHLENCLELGVKVNEQLK